MAFAESRIRAETIAAEDVLHDLGAISMMSSDSQAMGRIGEVIMRTWQTADKMKRQRGALPGEKAGSDNLRARRYVAKYTINPAIAHGIAHEVGSVEAGQARRSGAMEARIFRRQARDGAEGRNDRVGRDGRSERVDPHPAARDLPADVRGVRRARCSSTSLTFVSKAARAPEIGAPQSGAQSGAVSRNAASLTKRDMINNDALPNIEVDPDTYEVRADGELLTCEPAASCRWRSATFCSEWVYSRC